MADKTISGLTALPGTLDPAAILAIVQAGVTYHATGEQVSDMVLGNISVITNANGTALRIDAPTGRVQVCFHTLSVTGTSGAGVREGTWTFPAPFSASPAVVLSPLAFTQNVTAQGVQTRSNTSANLRLTVATGEDYTVMAIAIGKWED